MINYDNKLLTYYDRILTSIYNNDELIADEQICKRLDFALSTLYERERKIIELHYGEGLTLDEIAEGLNLTKERVRQIEFKALQKLKMPLRSDLILGSDECDALCERIEKLKKLEIDRQSYLDGLKTKLHELEQIEVKQNELLNTYKTIDDINLSNRTYNALKNSGYTNLSDIIKLSSNEIYNIAKLGHKSIKELKNTLTELGFTTNWKL